MSAGPPSPALQNPIKGTTFDSSPEKLGLNTHTNSNTDPQARTRTQSASKNVLKRTVEQTAARLGSSMLASKRDSGSAAAAGTQQSGSRLSSSFTAADPRRFLSLRRGKGKERDAAPDLSGDAASSGSRPALPSRHSASDAMSGSALLDDSPFIRPRSPSPSPSPPKRPSLDALQALGSMRAGTQTLIQAIQAIPWTDEPEADDDAIPPISANSDSSEEERTAPPIASSIHTIHRPIARSRKLDSPLSPKHANGKGKAPAQYSPVPASSDEEDGDVSDEDEDFELTPIEPHSTNVEEREGMDVATTLSGTDKKKDKLAHFRRANMTRSASLATVRIKRRTMLAQKLKEVFTLNDINEVVAELPCWLLRSVLLQGYMYLTNSHLCFFAHLPSREDQVLKSGSLSKKTQRTKRWVKHWFVLKNDVLSWYQSSADPYFPHGVVDLRYAISCDAVQEKGFRIRTNQKIVNLSADSVPSREEWVKAIRKVIFKAQNVGESVKIAIPYSVIVDVDKSSAIDFSETIEVKVVDKEDKASENGLDSYFFAYFQNISLALDQIRDAVKTYKPFTAHETGNLEVVHDTTGLKPATSAVVPERAVSEQSGRLGYGIKLASLLRPFQSDVSTATVTPNSGSQEAPVLKDQNSIVASPSSIQDIEHVEQPSEGTPSLNVQQKSLRTQSEPNTALPGSTFSHTYPPPPSPPPPDIVSVPASTSSTSSWGVPAWLRTPRRVFASPSASTSATTIGPLQREVAEYVSDLASSSRSADTSKHERHSSDFGFSILESKDLAEPEQGEKFRATFAFDEKEQLLGYFQGYLFRLLPTYGRLYISTNFFCFKSSGPLATRTRMQLPIRDILSLEKTKAYRFGHVGLVVIIKGHEELFFEFSSVDRRDSFVHLLEKQMEEILNMATTTNVTATPKKDALLLDEIEPAALFCGDDETKPPSDSLADSLPAVMFTSTSSTFLTFKPRQPLHITCLTIGTRGDVQPYIALAKGLMADGHTVRIATHGEFKDWIESYGIEFGYVGGDPAELMRICVENGMFTVSFLKEGIQKFRGWLDDLLKTSWEACKGTDVLIESPSAMSGLHIAEALRIPYYRGFTMTWTRTRAYPHAFAVPEHKMGGGYNYMSYVMFDQVFWRATAGQINRWRRNTLHLPGTNLDKMEPHKVPFLYNFSPTVVPPPLDWPEWIRVTGYWFLDDADVSATKWTPPADLVKFLDTAHEAGKKVVYIGFGSIVVSDPDAMTRCVVEAIVKSGVYAILSKGWSDRLHVKKGDASEPEIQLPSQIYPIKSIPHDWLFQRIEAACHHGGAGTTGASLRAGIPTIIKPFFGDQYFWGDRIEALGVGTCVRKLTVDGLAEALLAATTDEKQIAKAKLVGEKIRSENGVATAIESIYRDLEYARSLIKPSQSPPEDATIRDTRPRSSGRSISFSSPRSSADSIVSVQEGEDWSVISDSDDRRSSHLGESHSTPSTTKRSNIAAAVLSVLPDTLSFSSPKNVRG